MKAIDVVNGMKIDETLVLKIGKGCMVYQVEITRIEENSFWVKTKAISEWVEDIPEKEVTQEELFDFLESYKLIESWKKE